MTTNIKRNVDMLMRLRILATALATLSCSAAGEKKHIGTFSNEEVEFDLVTVVVYENGLAYYHAASYGVIGEWAFDEQASALSIKFFDPGSLKDETFKLPFDGKSRTYVVAKSENAPKGTLRFLTEEVPEKLNEIFKSYRERIKNIRAQTLAEKEWKRRHDEQLERERPEYDRVLQEIRENPKIVLTTDFHTQEITPTTRAFQASLKDLTVAYPEEVLTGLLEKLPDSNHWIRAIIFSRPELQPATLKRFYPKALGWGKLNYSILANIAHHPNTPLETVRDLASREDLPIGATNPAKARLKEVSP